ncbi:AAA family ATPase [Chryseobacterium sp. POL2]|nr:AAA family ATPase [Chryseobacterium sp. POL2]
MGRYLLFLRHLFFTISSMEKNLVGITAPLLLESFRFFNLSQRTGVDNAFSNPLSVIEGSPGTGKTQTILNIIANAVMNNQSVAVVSSNNSATKNIFEKLESNGVSFIAALLGSSQNA